MVPPTPPAAALVLFFLFFFFRRRIQIRRPARMARTARPPTAAPTMTAMFDFLGAGSGLGGVELGEGMVVTVGISGAGALLAG